MLNTRKAFTLAEVLIVIMVIGVVATMTMPTLISNIKGKRFYSQYKKSLSTLNNAALLNKAKFDFDLGEIETVCQNHDYHSSSDTPQKVMSACAVFNANLSGAAFLNIEDADHDTGHYFPTAINAGGPDFYSYTLADGSVFYFSSWLGRSRSNPCRLELGQTLSKSMISSHPECMGWIDVNGEAGPNKIVECSDGVATDTTPSNPCIVKNKDITDIFPVFIHDATIEPATNASAGVLLEINGKNAQKKNEEVVNTEIPPEPDPEPEVPQNNPLSTDYSYATSEIALHKAENVQCINCIVLTDVSDDVLGVVQSIKQCSNKGPCILDLNEAKALVDVVKEGNPMSVYSNITSQEAARSIIEELESLGAEVVWKGFDPSSEDLDALNASVIHSSSIVDSKIASFVECSNCVVLTRINDPDQRMNVLKAVKNVLNLNTQAANDWISNLPQSLMENMSEAQAQALIQQFENMGVGVVYK